jgi:hypothetical protein
MMPRDPINHLVVLPSLISVERKTPPETPENEILVFGKGVFEPKTPLSQPKTSLFGGGFRTENPPFRTENPLSEKIHEMYHILYISSLHA